MSRDEAERRRGFDINARAADRARNSSLFLDDLLDANVREFNQGYAEAEGSLLWQFRRLHADINGNREFVEYLRDKVTFLDHDENRCREQIHPQFLTLLHKLMTAMRRGHVISITRESNE